MRGCYCPFWHALHLVWTLLLLSARPATMCTMYVHLVSLAPSAPNQCNSHSLSTYSQLKAD